MTVSGETVTVVVADDQSAVREGLVLLLSTLPGITVAGQAADGEAAVELVAATKPQVILMDLNMPRCDGVAATARITAEHPGTRVVVLGGGLLRGSRRAVDRRAAALTLCGEAADLDGTRTVQQDGGPPRHPRLRWTADHRGVHAVR